MLNVLVGGILGLICSFGFLYWLRIQPEVPKTDMWADFGVILFFGILGALLGWIRHVDNRPTNKTP